MVIYVQDRGFQFLKLCSGAQPQFFFRQAQRRQKMNILTSILSTVQSRISDIKFSDNLWFSDYFSTTMPEHIYNPIRAMGLLAMFTFHLDNTKR